ncbi:ATP-binding protein cassette, subfamily B (MDR/TAP), member 1 [Sporothrix schenckii 1099-18]|uniref:ATP-binding protein cassette, subfamily B (MDR/TAP), member 1 n=1 Tax=Sporothrix schenckii 1099-18 TaxID=1397361 RepID=A0A0F2MAN4_SPOSC|nr:ATP-binding protein cassette, subfamily B (MDR/TAP), member 1 [Sporothrix schenckii 1099-18]KJR86139.1 ATP-binding protein cassette, subfamily B (MDR/TAP), member 1 [Sporothrix schenckii 1099-18]
MSLHEKTDSDDPSPSAVPNPNPNPLGLDEAELACLARQIDLPASTAGYGAIYRYADRVDRLVMFVSGVAACGAGSTMPLMTIVFGSLIGKFSDRTDASQQLSSFSSDVSSLCLYFVYVGVGGLVCYSLFLAGFTWTGQRIAQRMRAAYLAALLRQNAAFLDALGTGAVTTQITADMNAVQEGVSQKVGLIVQGVATFVSALVVSFLRSWRLALVMLSLPVAVTAFMVVVGVRMKGAQGAALARFADAASFAEEAIASMRTVAAYGVQRRFARRYDAALAPALRADVRAKSWLGVLIGGMMCMMLSSFALACWAGHLFLAAGRITTAQIVTVQFAMMTGAVLFGNIAPHLQAVGLAATAANRIFAVIDRTPTIDADAPDAVTPDRLDGHIEFRAVQLVYPARIGHLVLDSISLDVPAGSTVAVVGPSGSGKSSLVHLLQRFYAPLRGQVLVDGRNIEDVRLRWLRCKMRMVSQEPFLFDATVFDNIAYGLVGTEHEHAGHAAKQKLVEDAAKAADAHEFILQLPAGYQARVGAVGGRLSGGQRQRIAVARAVVSRPQILLLDEATAALDTKSEARLQAALARSGRETRRTTIVIAHRLSTVRHADTIVVMEHGVITEQGTHADLLAKAGTYASLAAAQDLDDDAAARQGTDVDRGSGRAAAGGEKVQAAAPTAAAAAAVLPQDTAKTSSTGDPDKDTETQGLAQQVEAGSGGAARLGSIGFLWALNRPEQTVMVVGLVGSAVTGLAYPLTAIFFGNMVLGFTDPGSTLGGYGVGFWAGMQLLLAAVILAAFLVQNLAFAFASARLVVRARSVAFAAILRQDMVFFAQPDHSHSHSNSAGALAAFLSVQANRLNGLSGAILGHVLGSVFAVVAGLVVAVAFGWKLGLVAASLMPLVFATGFARYRVLAALEAKNTRDAAAAAAVVAEAVRGARTVAALGLEDTVAQQYRAQLGGEARAGRARALLLAVLYGASQSVVVFGSALLFWYGGTHLLAGPDGYTVQRFLICYVATTYAAQAAGGIFSYAPDIAGAQEAVRQLRRLLAAVPGIDVEADDARDAVVDVAADDLAGDVELRAVDFAYPGKTVRALDQVSLQAGAGTGVGRVVALVGASGSGKSSVLNLLERLYDPSAGHVLANGRDLRHLHLQRYRHQLAIVDQDAVLYSGSVKDNIIMGDVDDMDDHGDVDDVRIERACRDANIWDFVTSLPEGINTRIGPRGSQVSGGQKQRLALARALLRNPKVLLLDEATSALDSHSEQVVQQALATAAAGRTTVAVAHRLSSIARADRIYVFERGSIVEQGNHAELMAMQGRYWEYVGMQNLSS